MPSAQLPSVHLFTDGACSGNPGPGGWAFILNHPQSGKKIERSGAEERTTNNRMELTAVIEGLSALKKPAQVELFTDSEYVGKGLSQWITKWKANGWKRRGPSGSGPLKNEDLWRTLDELMQTHRIRYHPIIGHSGHPENELCDQLAVAAYQKLLPRSGDDRGTLR
jgi:ribonuclease HI